jgi:hypothetical protein
MTVFHACDLPCSSRTASARVAAGTWQRPTSGVYVDHAAPLTPAELVLVARGHVGADFVVTGTLVLRELDLPWLPAPAGIHVLVPPDLHRPSRGVVTVTRTKDFTDLQTWCRYDARLADAERAVVDAARSLTTVRDVRGVVLGSVASRWATVEGLLAVLATTQRNGSGLTRRAIGDAHRGCASPPEAELVDALVGRGVPFYVNPELWLEDVLLGYPDIWLVGRGVGGEVESQEWHGDEEQTENTYDRHERFGAAGAELVHLSVRRIRADADEAATRLLSEPAVPEPAGLRVVPRGPQLR